MLCSLLRQLSLKLFHLPRSNSKLSNHRGMISRAGSKLILQILHHGFKGAQRSLGLPKTREPLSALGQQTIPIRSTDSESGSDSVGTDLRRCCAPLRHDNAQLSLGRTLVRRSSTSLRLGHTLSRRRSKLPCRSSAYLRLHRSSRHHTAQGCSHQRPNLSSHSTRPRVEDELHRSSTPLSSTSPDSNALQKSTLLRCNGTRLRLRS